MKNYTVSEISEMLDTNPETVRRWIRNGKLNATQTSRKGGNTITEYDFNNFLSSTPKYAAQMARKSSAASGLIIATAGITTAVLLIKEIADLIKKDDNNAVSNAELKQITEDLNEQIEMHNSSLTRKRETLSDLEKEIEDEEKEVASLQDAVHEINEFIEREGEINE